MKKVYKKLSKEQREKGIIFTSTLSKYRFETSEDVVKEVFADDENREQTIDLLLDDSFFNKSHWNFNIVRR